MKKGVTFVSLPTISDFHGLLFDASDVSDSYQRRGLRRIWANQRSESGKSGRNIFQYPPKIWQNVALFYGCNRNSDWNRSYRQRQRPMGYFLFHPSCFRHTVFKITGASKYHFKRPENPPPQTLGLCLPVLFHRYHLHRRPADHAPLIPAPAGFLFFKLTFHL